MSSTTQHICGNTVDWHLTYLDISEIPTACHYQILLIPIIRFFPD